MLEVASGLMIVILGFYLLWQRFIHWRKTISSSSPILPPKGEENHPFSRAEKVRMRRLTPLSSTTKKKPDSITIQKVPENFHHHGDGKIHSHAMPETITWRSLITLGISGGLVPCPDAIAILLVAIAINRIFLGLALIISFSIGLAVVLIAIGLLMVSSSRLFKRMDAFNKFSPFMPMISALIVLFLGFGLTYGAFTSMRNGSSTSLTGTGLATNVAQGAVTSLNSESSPLLTGTDLATNAAQIIYLNDDKNKQKQLFITDTKGSEPLKLTDAATGVVDFAISPDQTQVIYIAQTEDIKNELWMLDLNNKENKLVVSCGEAVCSQPVWSPDGKHIVYEYALLDTGTSSLWWFDVTTKKAHPVFQEARLPGTNPCWSPNGEWLSYATPDGIRLSNLASGESRVIPNILGAAVQWSPDNKSILIRDVLVKQNQYQYDTQLFLYDLASKTLTNVNANVTMDNILAAWSPDGKFIAVVRSDLNAPSGDQIWLMHADGSEAHVITNMPAVSHGSLNWSPDGKYILYDLYLLDTNPLTSRLEVVDIDKGKVTNLNVIGYNPKWIWQS
jgi:Tol biopolymer transport system component/cytochrome c biogenesis protein CcdA